MLNDASIDIDKELLGDYENGHIGIDDAEDVEEGGDDDLEQVDAETYEDTASKKDHIIRRTANYTEVEDEAFIHAWDSVTLDGVTGTDQTGKRYCNKLRTSFAISCLGLHIGHLGHTGHYKVDGMQSRLHVADGPLAWTKCGLHLRVDAPYVTM
jgi:hypothetical protein